MARVAADSPALISNDDLTGTLEQQLRQVLAALSPREAAIATAYLTPDGFMALKDQLGEAERVRILLGERPFLNRRGPSDRLGPPGDDDDLAGPGEAIDWHAFLEGDYPWLLLNHDERKALLAAGEADPARLDAFNLAAWEKVLALASFLERPEVAMRRYLGDRVGTVAEGKVLSRRTASSVRLHAKAYLFRGDEGAFATVGSSNLTRGGLTNNIELNLASHDERLVGELEGWFDGKWEQGQECKAEFIRLLESCVLFGRRYTPWQVFIKALDAAYGRFLDLSLAADVAGKLANFQQEAVSRCVALLDRHWGVMLCDSVGLGKTYEGLGILAEFSRRRREATDQPVRAVIICPAQLERNWSSERLLDNNILGETITMESLPDLVPDEIEAAQETSARRAQRERRLRHLQGADIILVDESHNFRNPATKRYQALMEIIRGGSKPDARVLLLTATPINNSPWDLYYQLSLITRGDDTWYAGRGPVANLRSTFRAIDKGGGEAGTGLLDTMLLSLVRRTRHDIRALQESGQPVELAGQPVRFPRHEIPRAINYSLSELYGPIYKQIIDTIQELHFAVYNLEAYGVETGERAGDTEQRVQQRNRTFIGIMRTIFLKRMESSVVALTHTIRSMVGYFDRFLDELDRHQRVLTPKDAQRLRAALGGSLPDDAIELTDLRGRDGAQSLTLPAAPADPGRRSELRAAVAEDREWLRLLLAELEGRQAAWLTQDDPKLSALRGVLEALPTTDAQGVPTKVVIFTNYKDTADYIFRGLGGGEAAGPGARPHRWRSNLAGERWIAKLTGADNQQRRQEVLSYFAPLAFTREAEPPDDPVLLAKIAPYRAAGIDLLVATDVLSEGQNLQDAQYLINYDLHWNPVRMIQRAGRIDRLFSPHERIFIYNIMPERELEALLKLVARLADKAASIEEMVGLDASVLGEQIESKTFDKLMKLAAGGVQADQVYREGEQAQGLDAAFTELNTYVQMVKDLGTEDIQAVPDGIYSVRKGSEAGVFVMLKMPEASTGQVYWRFYPLRPEGLTAGNGRAVQGSLLPDEERPAQRPLGWTDGGPVAGPPILGGAWGAGLGAPMTSPAAVIKLIEAGRDEPRLDLADTVNPFQFLRAPLGAAISQVGEDYLRHTTEQTQDDFSNRLALLLSRDDVLEAEPELVEHLGRWLQQRPPAATLNRSRVRDATRTIRALRGNATLPLVLERLHALWTGLQGEGLDRSIVRPESREPSILDLELVCWELIVDDALLGELTGHTDLGKR